MARELGRGAETAALEQDTQLAQVPRAHGRHQGFVGHSYPGKPQPTQKVTDLPSARPLPFAFALASDLPRLGPLDWRNSTACTSGRLGTERGPRAAANQRDLVGPLEERVALARVFPGTRSTENEPALLGDRHHPVDERLVLRVTLA